MLNKKKLDNLNCLVIGTGSIGLRHINNLKKIGINNISIFDNNKYNLNYASKFFQIKKFQDIDSALSSNPDFCVICTYPQTHIPIALKCIKNNSHVFIEKPISLNLINLEKLLKNASTKKLQIAVGYNLRFDKGLNIIKQKIKKRVLGNILSISAQWGHHIKLWRPTKNFREHYILKEGNGIILDDSHEYDYLRWLLDDEVHSVYCQTRKATSFPTQSESLASLILKFKKGAVANLLIDYMRPKYERNCQIIGEKGSIKWEHLPLSSNSWKNYNAKLKTNIVIHNLSSKSKFESFQIQSNNSYILEMKYFIDSIFSQNQLITNGYDALQTLKIGLAALKSARQNKAIIL